MKHKSNRRHLGGALLPTAVVTIFLRLDTCGHRGASTHTQLRAQPERIFTAIRNDLLPRYYL